jgi:hypothetical protein
MKKVFFLVAATAKLEGVTVLEGPHYRLCSDAHSWDIPKVVTDVTSLRSVGPWGNRRLPTTSKHNGSIVFDLIDTPGLAVSLLGFVDSGVRVPFDAHCLYSFGPETCLPSTYNVTVPVGVVYMAAVMEIAISYKLVGSDRIDCGTEVRNQDAEICEFGFVHTTTLAPLTSQATKINRQRAIKYWLTGFE